MSVVTQTAVGLHLLGALRNARLERVSLHCARSNFPAVRASTPLTLLTLSAAPFALSN